MTGRIHYGRHEALESEADRILSDELRPLPATQKQDILTPWKERQRRSHELYVSQGVPEAVYRGNFHRVYNGDMPHLNNTQGIVSVSRSRTRQYGGTRDGFGSGSGSYDDSDIGRSLDERED